jgi:hypothetical protein
MALYDEPLLEALGLKKESASSSSVVEVYGPTGLVRGDARALPLVCSWESTVGLLWGERESFTGGIHPLSEDELRSGFS